MQQAFRRSERMSSLHTSATSPGTESRVSARPETKPHLLTLPREVREMILKYCLIQLGMSVPSRHGPRDPPHVHFIPNNLAPQVLRVCKQLYEEGGNLLYTHNVFNLRMFPLHRDPRLCRLPFPVEKHSRISKIEVHIVVWDWAFPATVAFIHELLEVVIFWPRLHHLQWINCIVEENFEPWSMSECMGILVDEIDQVHPEFRLGHAKNLDDLSDRCGRLGGVARKVSNYIFKTSALQVARSFFFSQIEDMIEDTKLYRATRPLITNRIQRSIVLARAPIETMTGLHLNDGYQIEHVSSVPDLGFDSADME